MKFFEICAKTKSDHPEVLLYGSISEWGKIKAADFISNLKALEAKHTEVTFRIHSGGGSIFEGVPIYNAVENSKLKLTGIVDGLCASMMAVILQAFKTRKMVRGAKLMIHQGSAVISGGVKKIREEADLLETLNKDMAEIFAKRTGKTAEWVLENWMKDGEDKWFSAEEALREGLIDEVIDGKVKEATSSSFSEIAAHYDMEIAAFYNEQISNTNKPNMKKIAAKLGLAEDATEEQIVAAIEAIDKKDDADNGVKALVSLAVSKGFKKETIEKLAAADFNATLEMVEAANAPKEGGEADGTRLSDILAELKKGNSGYTPPAKSLRELEKEDPSAVKALMKDKPEEYQKLFKAEYGADISLDEIRKLI